MEVDHIDKLLERYLHLLHQYTTLREQLSSLQTGIYQNIARANFAAERGMRFGQDYYDERMRASRKVAITLGGDQDIPAFAVTAGSAEAGLLAPSEKGATTDDGTKEASKEEREKEEEKEEEAREFQEEKRKDPLRWFGLLTPMPLRQAQAQSIEAVEQVIPKLVSVNAQMAQVEIEVRRARKKRAKAEAAAVKQEQEVSGAGAGAEIVA
ncbi:hypothetical protein F5Y00DRAFT_26497 [Daldinia vernicosa]|uniref:uncharacterized protein n=1 Tax=Daldinia vernicosa TaxID=114800 RepID=UPI00200810E2|nr:uncharacterized protein F5Y00DRAFT_26497 [Daldinia vernicosa]KAI0851083.1 hypothetical protein F5Y00DRAFT_26497 [Daldinia vernicosa]